MGAGARPHPRYATDLFDSDSIPRGQELFNRHGLQYYSITVLQFGGQHATDGGVKSRAETRARC